MATAEEIAASKAVQQQEGLNRSDPIDDHGNRAPDPRVDLTADNTDPPEPQTRRTNDEPGDDPQPRERAKPIPMSPSDLMRANIAKRFRRDEEAPVEFNGDPNDPAMLYGKHGQQPEPEPEVIEPEPEPAPAPQPEKKFTIKVRGKDVQLTEAELLERASKVEAADSYLEEGRNLLEQAKQIRNDRERGPADPHRPEARTNTQDDLSDPPANSDPQHPEDELESAIEEVRYGTDPKEAAKRLRTVISKEANKATDEGQIKRLIGTDNAKSAKARDAFIQANPDLANDETACVVLEQQCYAIQRAELIEMGVDEAKLPKDTRTLAQWHQFQRVHGHAVSSQEQILEKAKQRFVQWKGGAAQPQPQPQPRRDAPRVEVSVDRNARREKLPNQPTRSGTPPPAINRQNDESGQPRSRSDVVMQMKKSRGQLVV